MNAQSSDLRPLLVESRPKLKGVFEKGLRLDAMWAESEIVLGAVLRLPRQGIVGLPLHDCVLVPGSEVAAGRDALTAASL